MKKLYRVVWPIIGILLIACGITLIANSNNKTIIPTIGGVFLLIIAVLEFGLFYLSFHNFFITKFFFLDALVSFIVGFLLLIFQEGALKFILICFGIYTLIYGISKLLHAYECSKNDPRHFMIALVEGLFLIVFSILSFFFQNAANNIVIIFAGIYLIVLGFDELFDAIEQMVTERKMKDVEKTFDYKKDAIDAEVKEMDEPKK